MTSNAPAPLPEPLQYLQAFADSLAKLPPDELNEDVDMTPLEEVLRDRFRGLDEDAVEVELDRDRDLLETWLNTEASSDHPAYWILGALTYLTLARHLIVSPESSPNESEATLDNPDG